MLRDNSNQLYISVASLWELAIKSSIGKLYELDGGIHGFIEELEKLPIYQIPVLPRHVVMIESMPFIHRDPFDRLLIATAKTDNLSILSADDSIRRYDASLFW